LLIGEGYTIGVGRQIKENSRQVAAGKKAKERPNRFSPQTRGLTLLVLPQTIDLGF
jgi:hypothetical protein